MGDVELIKQSNENNPFVAIVIGSFDLLSGIKVCYRWLFQREINNNNNDHPNEKNSPNNFDEIVKITLSNVHRQKLQTFEDCAISTIDVQCYEWYIVNSVFVQAQKTQNRNVYMSIGFIFDSNKIRKNSHLNDIITLWIKVLTYNMKSVLSRNEPFSLLRSTIDRISDESTRLVQSTIKDLPTFEPNPIDSQFYSIALTSHLLTQMTTIIESSNSLEAQKIANFLAHFTLPQQRELSSLEIQSQPTIGLFLQIVDRQKSTPDEFMSTFPRPITWIRLPERQIIRTADKCYVDQSLNSLQLLQMIISNDISDDQDLNKKPISRIKSIFKTVQCQTSSVWAVTTVGMMLKKPKCVRYLICEQSLGAIVRMAIAFVAIKNEKLEMTKTNSLSKEQISEIQKILKIPTNEDFSMLMSIAQIYDESIYTYFKGK